MHKIGYYDILKQIDKFIVNNEISSAVFDLFVHKSAENYFFKKIRNILWFDLLTEYSYFSSLHAPSPVAAEQEGYYSIPHWNVLDYLERVSEQVNIPENNKYIQNLIEIIKEVTANGDPDNYRTWYCFAIILSNIPNDYITIEDLKLFIPKWLNSQVDTSLPVKEISHRLLPKFSNPADFEKAEVIIDSLTTLRLIPDNHRGKGYLSGNEIFMPLVDLYWLNDAIEHNLDFITGIANKDLILNIQYKLERLLKKKEQERIFEFNDCNIVLVVSEDEIQKQYNIKIYQSMNHQTDDLYEQFIRTQNKQRNTQDELLTSFTISSAISLNQFVDYILENLTPAILVKFADDPDGFKMKLKYLYLGLYDKWTYESFLNISHIHSDEAIGIYHKILTILVTPLIERNTGDIENIFTSFFYSKYLYFKKFSFYLIGKYYDTLNKIFWKNLKQDENDYFLQNLFFGDEIKYLFGQIKELDKELIDLLNAKIDAEAAALSQLKEDGLFIKTWKQRYYKALSSIPYFSDKYNKFKADTKLEPELGPAFSMGESRWGTGPSPVSVEDLEKMSCEDIVSLLQNFKSDNTWDGLSEETLSDQLKELVKINPYKISNEIILFRDVAYKYIYEILSGFTEAWNNNIKIDWGVIFEFIEKYINRKEFWEDKLDIKGEHLRAKHVWVVNAISELIESGVRNDENAFPETLNLKVLDIFDIIQKNITEENSRIDDPISSSLNSTHGRLITAIILFSLREARLKNNSEYSDNWESRIKPVYNSLLENKVKDSYTLLGQYIANLHFIDSSWAIEKINLMQDESDDYWILFMTGYFYSNNIYTNIYQLMKDNYLRYLDCSFENNTLKRLFINHVGFGYFRELEKPGESLYNLVIKRWDIEDVLHLIDYFWRQRDSLEILETDSLETVTLKRKAIEKILNFWESLYSRYYELPTNQLLNDDKRILSSVTRLAVYIDEITEINIHWLIQTAPFADVEHHSPFFVEYLNILKDKGTDKIKSANYICDIYLALLNVFVPDFDKDHIRETIQYMYELSSEKSDLELKEKVNDICNIYGQNGVSDDKGREFLRDLYEDYNKRN